MNWNDATTSSDDDYMSDAYTTVDIRPGLFTLSLDILKVVNHF